MLALQASQQRGKGAVHTVTLMTVPNSFWGTPGGVELNITFIYLSRAFEWEDALPDAIRAQVVPLLNPADPASLPLTGEFKLFPHFLTSELHYSAKQASLLSHLCAWVVLNNREHFED